MADTFKLPEASRRRLVILIKDQNTATRLVNEALAVTLECLDLDPKLDHGINWETGEITPAEAPKPTPIREEAPAEASG